MEPSVKIEGLDEAMKAMLAAFPADPKKQRQLVNGAMRASAARTILPVAKSMSLAGDGSGALSEALGIRNQSRKKLAMKQGAAGVEVVPVRSNRKAMMMYIAHYYTGRGINPPAEMITSGIRHGHLVEFGTGPRERSGPMPARPFLWPAGSSQAAPYKSRFAGDMKKKIEAAVKREAKKRAKK